MASHEDHLPLIPGVTETSPMGEDEPTLRLVEEMRGRLPRPTRERVASAVDELESAFKLESDERTRARIGAALAMLRGTYDSRTSPSDSSMETRAVKY